MLNSLILKFSFNCPLRDTHEGSRTALGSIRNVSPRDVVLQVISHYRSQSLRWNLSIGIASGNWRRNRLEVTPADLAYVMSRLFHLRAASRCDSVTDWFHWRPVPAAEEVQTIGQLSPHHQRTKNACFGGADGFQLGGMSRTATDAWASTRH